MCDHADTPSKPPDAFASIRVLAAEDSPMNLTLIEWYLKGPEYTLETAVDGAVAVEKFQGGQFDIVLMDLQMPVMDGYAATRAIRAWEKANGKKPTPILALTAHAYAEQRRQSEAAGCNAHLIKPILKPDLIEAIQSFALCGRQLPPLDSADHNIQVRVPPGVEEAIPLFLELALEEVQSLEEALRKNNYDRIRSIGHDLKGTGSGYGFDGITEIGKWLEVAGKAGNWAEAKRHISSLKDYLARVEVV